MGRIPQIYPNVKAVIEPQSLAAGRFIGSQPSGLTIHYTASGTNLEGVLATLRKEHLGYHFIIERDGRIVQTCYLDSKVNHSGKASWNGKSPNQSHAAIALVGWGWLQTVKGQYRSYAGKIIAPADVVHANGLPWEKATDAQIASLNELVAWFVGMGISLKDICGHDECALPAGRKSDPGGMLPMKASEMFHG